MSRSSEIYVKILNLKIDQKIKTLLLKCGGYNLEVYICSVCNVRVKTYIFCYKKLFYCWYYQCVCSSYIAHYSIYFPSPNEGTKQLQVLPTQQRAQATVNIDTLHSQPINWYSYMLHWYNQCKSTDFLSLQGPLQFWSRLLCSLPLKSPETCRSFQVRGRRNALCKDRARGNPDSQQRLWDSNNNLFTQPPRGDQAGSAHTAMGAGPPHPSRGGGLA